MTKLEEGKIYKFSVSERELDDLISTKENKMISNSIYGRVYLEYNAPFFVDYLNLNLRHHKQLCKDRPLVYVVGKIEKIVSTTTIILYDDKNLRFFYD